MKRIITLLLIGVFLVSLSGVGFAASKDYNKYNENKIKAKKLMPSEVDPSHSSLTMTQVEREAAEIEEFGKTLADIDKDFQQKCKEALENNTPNADVGIQWSSDYMNYDVSASTHRWITWKAKNILLNDGKTNWYNLIDTYKDDLYNGSDDADFDGISSAWIHHFHEPDTDKGLLGTDISAADKCQEFFDAAVSYWNMDLRSAAMYFLGKATHYLQDCSEPHHAALYAAPLTSHDEFEEYANSIKDMYVYTSGGWYDWASTPWQYCDDAAYYAKAYIGSVDDVNDQSNWDYATDMNLWRSQKTSVGLIGEFFQEVGEAAN